MKKGLRFADKSTKLKNSTIIEKTLLINISKQPKAKSAIFSFFALIEALNHWDNNCDHHFFSNDHGQSQLISGLYSLQLAAK
jgi:hypothetical protein